MCRIYGGFGRLISIVGHPVGCLESVQGETTRGILEGEIEHGAGQSPEPSSPLPSPPCSHSLCVGGGTVGFPSLKRRAL